MAMEPSSPSPAAQRAGDIDPRAPADVEEQRVVVEHLAVGETDRTQTPGAVPVGS